MDFSVVGIRGNPFPAAGDRLCVPPELRQGKREVPSGHAVRTLRQILVLVQQCQCLAISRDGRLELPGLPQRVA